MSSKLIALIVLFATLAAPAALAQKEQFVRSKPHVNVATFAEDEGRLLLRAIAATWDADGHRIQPSLASIDNAPEEKERGLTLQFETPDRHYEDGTGDAGRIKNMVTGAAQMDGAILVVSASNGTTAQTREHVLLARQVGVPSLVVLLDDVDLVASPALLDLVEVEIRDLLTAQRFDGTATPIIRGSALGALNGDPAWRDSIRRLIEALDAWVPLPTPAADKPFLMAIEDVFSIPGRGTVATGRIETGRLAAGDDVDVAGFGGGVRIAVGDIDGATEADEGPGLGRPTRVELGSTDLRRGMVIARPGTITPHTNFRAILVPDAKPGTHAFRPLLPGSYVFKIRTADVAGTLSALPGVPAGSEGPQELLVDLAEPVVLGVGTPLSIREGGRTVGAGQVTEIIR